MKRIGLFLITQLVVASQLEFVPQFPPQPVDMTFNLPDGTTWQQWYDNKTPNYSTLTFYDSNRVLDYNAEPAHYPFVVAQILAYQDVLRNNPVTYNASRRAKAGLLLATGLGSSLCLPFTRSSAQVNLALLGAVGGIFGQIVLSQFFESKVTAYHQEQNFYHAEMVRLKDDASAVTYKVWSCAIQALGNKQSRHKISAFVKEIVATADTAFVGEDPTIDYDSFVEKYRTAHLQ